MAKSLENTTKSFLTYNSKQDPFNTSQSYLMPPSRNMLISDREKIATRLGFTLLGAAGVSGSSISGSFEWNNSSGQEYDLRVQETEAILQVLINGVWQNLMSSLAKVNLIFDQYWDDAQSKDQVIWCDGSANITVWSGAVATLQSISSNTVTVQGANTLAQQRFLLPSTGTAPATPGIMIQDDNGTWHSTTYSGGVASTTLTGIADNLTAFPFSGGNLIMQSPQVFSNYVSSAYLIDFIHVINNQLWVGSNSDAKYFFSNNGTINVISFSSPPNPGDGGFFISDATGRAIGDLRGDVILFSGTGYIYRVVFGTSTDSSGIVYQQTTTTRLKTTATQGAQHQTLVENIGNGLAWIGNDNVLYELSDATLAYSPKISPVSDPIKPDFDALDFGAVSGNWGHLKMKKNRLYVSAPAAGLVYIYEYRLNDRLQQVWFWQSPQILPVKRFAVIADAICGHSSEASETYTLFTGLRDNGNRINFIASLGRWNGGLMQSMKNVLNMFTQGSASFNTKINVTYFLESDDGEQNNINETIEMMAIAGVYTTVQDPSLGNITLSDVSLGGDTQQADLLPRFRVRHELAPKPFFDYGVQFETNDLDMQWGILAHGNDAEISGNIPTGIGD